MARLEYSTRAEDDLVDISLNGQERFGVSQASRYMERLEEACRQLADFPGMGRACKPPRNGLLRFEEGGHVIFYRRTGEGIIIGRVLHKSSDLALHVIV